MKLKSILAFMAAIVLVASVMVGCSNDKKDNTSSAGSSSGSMTSDIESGISDITSDTESTASDVESDVTGGSQTAVTGKLKEAYDAVKSLFGDDYLPNMPYDETYISEQFMLNKDMYKQIVAEGPMISVNVDTFIGVEAAEGKAEDVEKALNEYRQKLADDTMQYPMNIGKVKGAKVARYGDYVFFVMLGVANDDVMDMDEAGQLEYFQNENQKALDAISAVVK